MRQSWLRKSPKFGLAIGILLSNSSQSGCGSGEQLSRSGPSAAVGKSIPSVGRTGEPLVDTKASPDGRPVPPSKTIESNSSFRLFPETFKIPADAPGLQLQAIQVDSKGEIRDLTRNARWEIEPAGIARVDTSGYVRPALNGAGVVKVVAFHGDDSSYSSITIEKSDRPSWDFAEQIVPILTKLGCNTGGCHGKADGQNGFHLSLFGYDPEADFRSIARDLGQRRVLPIEPAESLLLKKASATVFHGGGARLSMDSPEYRRLKDWIAAGTPETTGLSHGRLESVRVEPSSIHLKEPGPAQVRVIAKYPDGHEQDVTPLAMYRTLDDAAASVTQSGWVNLRSRAETDLIVRYGSRVISARISTSFNPALNFDYANLPRRNFIDEELIKRLEALKVPVSPRAPDAAFLRRASLDLTGQQPTPQEIREFLADKDAEKRTKLIDRLLASPEFVLSWRIKLGDLLQISPSRQGNTAYKYQSWIDQSLKANRPWDELVRTLLTALGDPNDFDAGGPVNYALDSFDPTIQAEQTAQRFLGLRLRCAQCHDHPFDVWTQDDYFGLAAFFAKVQRGGMAAGVMADRTIVTLNPGGKVFHLRTGNPVEPRLLDRKPVTIPSKDDPRQALAAWLVAPDNPFFSRTMANWTWAQLFGRGLVDPPDDMSRANAAVHPALLDALAKHFVSHKFDVKDLIRTIAVSETYALSAATVVGNEKDFRLFSHHVPRPLTAHQMADALAQATDVPNRFEAGAQMARSKAERRSIDLVNPLTPSLILDTFGRCDRSTTCASVPAPTLSLRQSLLLIGGDLIEAKIADLNGYLASALSLELEPEELVENLYFRTVCRAPTTEEQSRWSTELRQSTSPKEAAEDLFWSLLNSREFAFNH